MSTAADTLSVEDRSEWLDELDRILECWGSFSHVPQESVIAVVQTFLDDPETSPTDAATAWRLLARMRSRSDVAWDVIHGRRNIRVSAGDAALA